MGKVKHSVILLLLWQGLICVSFGQQSAFMTQYVDNPLVLNPAYAGSRNSLAVDLFSRQQWVGIDGAPSVYYVGAHFPINKSMASLGGTLWSDHVGPVMYNRLAFDYAYLVRVSRRAFLSMGIRAGADHFNVKPLNVIDYSDPEFSESIDNQFRPSAGAGFVFYTPTIFFGFSVPHFSFSKMPWASDVATEFQTRNEYNLTGGINMNITREINTKLSLLHRIVQNEISTTDVSLMFRYEDLFKGGISYRLNYAYGIILGMKINDDVNVTYSYEVPTQWQPIVSSGVHELTVSFDFTKYIIPNRHRRFLNKKVVEEEINSIRYF